MLLSPYRVLDLSDERGQLTGLMLAQLGSEVIAVEPPGGSRSRAIGPFAGDDPDPEKSLQHWAYNRGKKSVVLDYVASDQDRAALLELIAGADVLIESGAPGDLAALGLGPDDLARVNPSLVYGSITPFGQDGPKANWAASDLTVWAAAGPMALTGDSDRAPLRMPSGQSFCHAAAEAAGAICSALLERGSSGLGQHIDVSAQQASAQATQSNILAESNGTEMMTREAGGLMLGEIFIQLRYPCSDGWVSVTFLFGSALGVATQRMMAAMLDMGFVDQEMHDKDWVRYGEMLITGEEPPSEYQRAKDCVTAFCMAHTKAELLELAMTKGLLIAPINNLEDVVGLEQFREREYWDEVDGFRYPGPFAKVSNTPLERPGPAPAVGADTAAILAEPKREPSAPPPIVPVPTAKPLEGVKILDFMWVMAGPVGTRVLADMGATVIRVESTTKIDAARTLQPFKDGVDDLETSTLFANCNAGKQGITLDPGSAEGRAVIEDLVRWADVVTESFSPKAMQGWGLDYEALREINPSVIMLSSCLFGQTGPLSMFAGYGTMAAAVTGFFGVVGWPDRPPSGAFGAYTDYISPRFANAALLAALDHRRRTGEGQRIDFSQAEASLHTLAPLVLDLEVNGRLPEQVANADPEHHPHGVFQSEGENQWVAIACTTDAERTALLTLVGALDDETLTAWTGQRTPEQATSELQSIGVPSHPVYDSTLYTHDEHVVSRGALVTLPHPAVGEMTVEGPRYKMSRSTIEVMAPGPMVGQHTTQVLTELLGYPEERFVELLVSGAME